MSNFSAMGICLRVVEQYQIAVADYSSAEDCAALAVNCLTHALPATAIGGPWQDLHGGALCCVDRTGGCKHAQ